MASDIDQELIDAAKAAAKFAYAPHSGYQVGAAVLGANGKIWTGCNIENSSYGATMCAERVAIFKMVSEGIMAIACIAIHTVNGGPPCGSCLQVIQEFSPTPVRFLLSSGSNTYEELSLAELLPRPFSL